MQQVEVSHLHGGRHYHPLASADRVLMEAEVARIITLAIVQEVSHLHGGRHLVESADGVLIEVEAARIITLAIAINLLAVSQSLRDRDYIHPHLHATGTTEAEVLQLAQRRLPVTDSLKVEKRRRAREGRRRARARERVLEGLEVLESMGRMQIWR